MQWQPIESLVPKAGLVAVLTDGKEAYVCEWYTWSNKLWSRATGIYGHEWEEGFKPSEAIAWLLLPEMPKANG